MTRHHSHLSVAFTTDLCSGGSLIVTLITHVLSIIYSKSINQLPAKGKLIYLYCLLLAAFHFCNEAEIQKHKTCLRVILNTV